MSAWRPGRVALLAASIALLGGSPTARAYRTTQDSEGAMGITGPVAWRDLPVEFELNQLGSDDLPFESVEAAIQRAFGHWTEPACSALRVRYLGAAARTAVRRDDHGTVSWIERGWADLGYPSAAIAVTTPQYGSPDGRRWYITEADMEMNGVNFTWVIDGGVAGGVTVDIEGIVTHESGHWFGILHPCEYFGQDGAPDCRSERTWDATTMFPAYTGEGQRSPEQDDIDAICFLYPGGGGGGCETTGCPAGQTCVAGVCQAGGGCQETGCPAGQTCGADGSCAPADCRTTGCPAGQTCGADGACVGSSSDCTITGCPAGQSCLDGACRLTPSGALGDYCASNAECTSGLCTTGADSFCTQFCDGSCPDGFRCVPVGANSVCEPLTGRLGDPCTSNGECLSGQCAVSGGGSFCTRECGNDPTRPALEPCPEGFGCVAAAGTRICRPDDPGCGCSAPGSGPSPGAAALGLGALGLGALGLAMLGRQRRRRGRARR